MKSSEHSGLERALNRFAMISQLQVLLLAKESLSSAIVNSLQHAGGVVSIRKPCFAISLV